MRHRIIWSAGWVGDRLAGRKMDRDTQEVVPPIREFLEARRRQRWVYEQEERRHQ